MQTRYKLFTEILMLKSLRYTHLEPEEIIMLHIGNQWKYFKSAQQIAWNILSEISDEIKQKELNILKGFLALIPGLW